MTQAGDRTRQGRPGHPLRSGGAAPAKEPDQSTVLDGQALGELELEGLRAALRPALHGSDAARDDLDGSEDRTVGEGDALPSLESRSLLGARPAPDDDDDDDLAAALPPSDETEPPLPRPRGSTWAAPPPRALPTSDATRIEALPAALLADRAAPVLADEPHAPDGRPRFVITRHAPLPPLEAPPAILRAPMSGSQLGELDLAEVLGLTPRPRVVAEAPAPPPPRTLEEVEALEPPLIEAREVPAPRPAARERAPRPTREPGSDEARRLTRNATVLARVIPLVLGILLVLSTVTVTISLFRGKGRTDQAFVELRFLGHLGAPAPASADGRRVRISVETRPEGVLVLHGREILGKTPLFADLPLALEERVGVELVSTHFERSVTEVTRTPGGEYHVTVDLVPRR